VSLLLSLVLQHSQRTSPQSPAKAFIKKLKYILSEASQHINSFRVLPVTVCFVFFNVADRRVSKNSPWSLGASSKGQRLLQYLANDGLEFYDQVD